LVGWWVAGGVKDGKDQCQEGTSGGEAAMKKKTFREKAKGKSGGPSKRGRWCLHTISTILIKKVFFQKKKCLTANNTKGKKKK